MQLHSGTVKYGGIQVEIPFYKGPSPKWEFVMSGCIGNCNKINDINIKLRFKTLVQLLLWVNVATSTNPLLTCQSQSV